MEIWMKEIPGSAQWTQVDEIAYGWSGEKKYHIRREGGPDLLLRVADGAAHAKMRVIHEAMQPVNGLHIRASQALYCVLSADGAHSWALLSYIDGASLESSLPALAPEEQYRLGWESGETLRKIHSLPASASRPGWAEFFNAKIDRKRARWHESGLQADGAQLAFDFIDRSRPLLDGRPQSLQHGDYHCGNMVLTPDGHVGVIDFNRLDWGDPWEEFNRIIWDVRASHAFARGRVDGYFAGRTPPEEFWRLLALYVTNDQVSALPWAVAFGEEEIQIARANFAAVLSWYDGFSTVVPSWYREK